MISEQLYSSHGDVIVARRRSTLLPFALIIAAAAALVINFFIENTASTTDLKSTLVVTGIALGVVGIVLLVRNLIGRGEPYDTRSRKFLRYMLYTFGHEQRDKVLNAVSKGDINGLEELPQSEIPAIVVAAYFSPDKQFVAMQPFAYSELEYHALSEITVKR